MNVYEQLKNQFFVELYGKLPDLPREHIVLIGQALDCAVYPYDVTVKETSLCVAPDPIPALVKTYIVVKKTEGLSDGTLFNYAHTLKSFFLWCRKQPEEVTANDIRMFVFDYQKRHRVSDRTLDKYREYICWFFSWAHTEEYISRNPARAVKGIKYEAKERQALSQIELEYLRLACETVRERALVEFMYSTGCRVSELIGVKLDDIDWRNNTVHLFGKGKKHRTSFINAKCEVALKEYMRERAGDSEYLFVSSVRPHAQLKKATVESVIRTLAARTGIRKRITPHVLRHTTATQAVNNGMPIEEVSKLLGHASVATTMIYAKVSHDTVHNQHTKCII